MIEKFQAVQVVVARPSTPGYRGALWGGFVVMTGTAPAFFRALCRPGGAVMATENGVAVPVEAKCSFVHGEARVSRFRPVGAWKQFVEISV